VPRTHYQLLDIKPNATRAEIDAGLTRRESQYRELVRTGKHPDQRIIERVRKAHATLVDPEKRAAYDQSLARAARRAPPSTAGARASWPATGAGAGVAGSAQSVGSAWKPFGLIVATAALLAGATLPAGQPVVASLTAVAPWLPIALVGLLATLCAVGAVLLWRRASDVDRRILGYLARAVSIVALIGIGFAIYAAATSPLLRIAP
jgi:hypothetical protein